MNGIDDVLQRIEAEELLDVVLAVHSCAGTIGTAVADRLGQRLRRLVHVDAVPPKARHVELQTGRDPMVSAPAALVRLLPGCSA